MSESSFDLYNLEIIGPIAAADKYNWSAYQNAPASAHKKIQFVIPVAQSLATIISGAGSTRLWYTENNIDLPFGITFAQEVPYGWTTMFGDMAVNRQGRAFIQAVNRGYRATNVPQSVSYAYAIVPQNNPSFPYMIVIEYSQDRTNYIQKVINKADGSLVATTFIPVFNTGATSFDAYVGVKDAGSSTGYSYYMLGWDTLTLDPVVSINAYGEIPSEYVSGFIAFFDALIPINPDNPYPDLPPSGEYPGGDPEPTGSEDILPDPVPTVSMADTGFTTIYNPTLAELQYLASYMWTTQNFWDTISNGVKKIFENPMDAMISLSLMPVSIPNGGSKEFKLLFVPTGVNLTKAANQFVPVDCGSFHLGKKYDSALDYSPYTKVSLYLPYIGVVPIDCDDVMGKDLSIRYVVDIVSGSCVADVMVNGSIHYTFSGTCGMNLPITSGNFTGIMSAVIQTAKAVGSIAAGATGQVGVAAALAGAPIPHTTDSSVDIELDKYDPKTDSAASRSFHKEKHSTSKASFSGLVTRNINNTVGEVMGSKIQVQRSGTFTGCSGYLAKRRPFIIVERPRLANPNKYGDFNGYPSLVTTSLNNVHGFTQVQQIQLTGFAGTNPELDELLGLLKSGVIM